ncbi:MULTISPECIES: hypothetical protein [Chromobacterium]|uniref:Uncharacterized protein n=1 Tax=Chromobacterium rhizoryzae TaxID=1778675 RepID=A0AAD0W8P4_9NEIS|nr:MULTISPECIES: hypothetical protein [Chromobacterium]AXT46571.1 hypothetical protein D1345_10400 [Chromobacterium rhizoryzae]QOD84819.1 hypothetical protein IEZ30_10225 [Chromobacterium haemolyticum]
MNPQHLHDMPDTGAALAGLNEAHASGLFNADSNSINGIQIYAMNDCDWVVARSREEAITFYRTFSEDAEDWEGAEELSSKALDKLKYATGECLSGPTISFRARLQQIVDNGEDVPDLFASTEF